jgi:putative flippase GtrA
LLGVKELVRRQVDREFLSFVGVGATGLAFTEGWLYYFVTLRHLNPIVMLAIGLEISIWINFFLNDNFTFIKGRKRFSLRNRFLIFHGQAMTTWFVNVGVYSLLIFWIGPLLAELLAVFTAFGINYFLAKRVTWYRTRIVMPEAGALQNEGF